jgi:(1->4)-alpha-D-glucan 1-alpha-D-glucosylmutase
MPPGDTAAPRQRRATYRLQLRAEFDFAAASAQAEYLARLGISHVYCSPYLQAARGSTHGYDVVDPTRISEDLGGDDGHRAMCESFAARGLTQLLDIVPNHMSIADRRNRWWWDVLADGQGSPYSAFFDIDWEIDEPKLRHRVLLPVLGDHVGRVLEDGRLRLASEGGTLWIAYQDSRYPLSIETVAELLTATTDGRLDQVVAAVSSLPPGKDEAGRQQRYQARTAIAGRVAELLGETPIAAAVDAVLGQLNTDVAALDRILNEQHHRLARWQTGVEEVNYRRFFDIDTLVALRIEDPMVFTESTLLVAELVRRGDVDGLRIDHIDGLRRPLQYAQRLREAIGSDAWLLAEKIFQRGEQPPPWSLDGTSGYDFLAAVNGLFVDPEGRAELVALHEEVTAQPSDFAVFALEGKREILRTTLVSDVERLTGLLATVCDAYPAHRDSTHSEIRAAIVELAAAVSVYRTYIDPRTPPASDVDAAVIRRAAAAVGANAPEVDKRLLGFIVELCVLGEAEDVATADEDMHLAQGDFVLRLQQLCAATMAKGVEDTACYRHLVLVSLNEVGDSPAHFGMDVASFHEFNARTQSDRPLAMLATSTHDTKRSEDVRCRINLLSEVPREWASCVRRWRVMNDAHRHGGVPDPGMEYLLYQTLVGAWPLTTERVVVYMDKAAHEAKRGTSWLQPDEAYDGALREFVTAVLADPRFTTDVEAFVATLVHWGRVNSLATTLLKLTSPGVPDIYQGCELWELSLVDPDNRRPVDYERRHVLLDELSGRSAARAWSDDPAGGAAKLLLIRDALALRARIPASFDERGTYAPAHARGVFADDVVAFIRGLPAAVIAIAQRRSLGRSGQWGDTMLQVPDGEWHNICDGTTLAGGDVSLQEVLARFPVALLERAG